MAPKKHNRAHIDITNPANYGGRRMKEVEMRRPARLRYAQGRLNMKALARSPPV